MHHKSQRLSHGKFSNLFTINIRSRCSIGFHFLLSVLLHFLKLLQSERSQRHQLGFAQYELSIFFLKQKTGFWETVTDILVHVESMLLHGIHKQADGT